MPRSYGIIDDSYTAAQIAAGQANNLPAGVRLVASDTGAEYATRGGGVAPTRMADEALVTSTVAAGAAVPDWAASKAYNASDVVAATVTLGTVAVRDLLRRKTAGTSRAAFDATESAAWDELGAQVVRTVATRTGDITLSASDVSGLGGAATLNVGTASGTVAAGNDSRLSDARTPTSHASTHGSAGADAITPAAIGAATTAAVSAKQDTLVSGTHVRTVNGSSIVGPGNLSIAADLPGGAAATITDEGLGSGNAAIDRASQPGFTLLRYITPGSIGFTAPLGVTQYDRLMVGGGGGGGVGRYRGDVSGRPGGGGGAGEFREELAITVAPGASFSGAVGAGGAGATDVDDSDAGNGGLAGGNTTFGLTTARGGGGGGGHKAVMDAGGTAGWDRPADTGGSGGGGSNGSAGAAATAVAPGLGSAGGQGATTGAGGGGGGAGGVGESGANGGDGGAGATSTITGLVYAAGGGGSKGSGATDGAGTSGVSGTGGAFQGGAGGSGVDGRGGGGGGSNEGGSDGLAAGQSPAGSGGGGAVVIRFATQTRTYQSLTGYANDAAAATGGILVGQFYRDSSTGTVRQRVA